MRKNPLLLATFVLTASVADAGSDDLAKALRGVTSADSYAFTVRENAAAPAVEAKYQKGVPISFKADRIEFFRKGELLVYKQGDAWQRTRTGTLSDPLLILGASAKVRAARLPHEELAILGKALTKVKKTEAIINGEFSAEAAKQLARSEDRDLARGGTAKLWLDGDGRLAKYEIAIRVQGVRGNAEVDGVITRIVTVAELGKVKIDVPVGAKKALEP